MLLIFSLQCNKMYNLYVILNKMPINDLISYITHSKSYKKFIYLSRTCGVSYPCDKPMLYHRLMFNQILPDRSVFDTAPCFNASPNFLSCIVHINISSSKFIHEFKTSSIIFIHFVHYFFL